MPDLLHFAQRRIPLILDHFLSDQNTSATRLSAAVRYAVINGGKRVRPALCYATAHTLGIAPELVEPAALAVELIHCYSLVHDDLPCMDNDDLRRGQPTTHKAFDEATALLAGDTLQTLAFAVLLQSPLSATQHCAQVVTLSQASADMAVGQALDIEAEGSALDAAQLEYIHRHKTGALIRSAVTMAAIAAQADQTATQALDNYAERLGLAFQVHDDVLDVIGDTAKIGKQTGADAARAKPTYPAIMGLAHAQAFVASLHEEALAALSPLGQAADPLRSLANFLVQRDH